MSKNKDTYSTIDESEIPGNWAIATINSLITGDDIFSDGDWVESKDQDPEGEVRLIQLADIGNGEFLDKSNRFLTEPKAEELNCTFLNKDDILIARMPDPLGRATLFPLSAEKYVTVVDVCIVRSQNVNHKWLMYFINSPQFRIAVARLQSGSTRKRISRKNLSKIRFPVPPYNEQQRIVDKIEELFSKIDDGIKSLKKVKKQLGYYRQSVLKAAVEGKLTKEWREENSDSLESADQLLERILDEHRERWEEEYRKKYEDKGKDLPKNWKSRYSEPDSPNTSDFPELPDVWTWVTFDQMGHWKGGGTPKRSVDKYWNGNIPWVSPKEMKRKWIEDTQDHTNELGIGDSSTKLVNSHSLLFVTRSGILKHTLPAAINTTEVTVNQDMKALEAVESINTEYLYLCTQAFNGDILHECSKHGTTVQSLESDKLYNYIIPLPPLGEQQEIVDRAERILSVIDQHKKTLSNEFKRAKNLESSILNKAFRGELVQQDPEDEPASELLERIQEDVEAEKQVEMEL